MPPPLSRLGELPIERFLSQYWQRKPLLARRALPDFRAPLSADELAGLALEQDVESRIVLERGGHSPWELLHGPFSETTFQKLPTSHWTLLVQAVDQWVPEVHALLDYFRFIPNWRLDDIMISYAADQGSVGPHFDHYDVFLLQANGTRRWQIGQRCDSQSLRLPGTDLDILASFEAVDEWLLEPGDLLYIPPQIAHWGIAEGDDCMTYSIGFRAPSHADILGEFSQELAASLAEQRRFQDPGGKFPHNPGELDDRSIEQVQRILRQYLDQPQQIANWFGRYMTQPKYPLPEPPLQSPLTPQTCTELLVQAQIQIQWQLGSRFAYRRTPEGAELFVDGEGLACPLALAKTLCGKSRFCGGDFAPFLHNPEALTVLTQLLNSNCLETKSLFKN